MNGQIIEITLTAQRSIDASIVSEAEINLIGVFLTEIFADMLHELEVDEE